MDFECTGIGPKLEAVEAIIAPRVAVLTHFQKTRSDGIYIPITIKNDTPSKSVLHEPDAPTFVKQNS